MTVLAGLITIGNTMVGFWGFYLFLISVIFILLFKTPIAAFLSRLTKLGVGKVAAEAQEQSPEQKPPTPISESLTQQPDQKGDPRRTADEIMAKLVRSEYMIEQDNNIKKLLADLGLEPGSPETYRVVTAILASALVIAEFEQLYNVIWTTQLQILQDLNPRSPLGFTVEEIREYYNRGASLLPQYYDKHPFEAYLGYLTSQRLLVDAGPGRYQITVKGRALLLYLVNEGKALVGRVY